MPSTPKRAARALAALALASLLLHGCSSDDPARPTPPGTSTLEGIVTVTAQGTDSTSAATGAFAVQDAAVRVYLSRGSGGAAVESTLTIEDQFVFGGLAEGTWYASVRPAPGLGETVAGEVRGEPAYFPPLAIEPTALIVAWPNPFSYEVRFRTTTSGPVPTGLQVNRSDGTPVRILLMTDLGGGVAEAEWDGRDGAGQPVVPGAYLAHTTGAAPVQLAVLAKQAAPARPGVLRGQVRLGGYVTDVNGIITEPLVVNDASGVRVRFQKQGYGDSLLTVGGSYSVVVPGGLYAVFAGPVPGVTYSVTASVDGDTATAPLLSIPSTGNILAYPNPFVGSVSVRVTLGTQVQSGIRVVSTGGAIVYTEPAALHGPGTVTFTWAGNTLGGPAPAGYYWVEFYGAGINSLWTLVKKE